MIKRYILHLEFHRGYRPKISFRRAPQAGQVTLDGGEYGILVRCPECSGDGLLHQRLAETQERHAALLRHPSNFLMRNGD